MHSYISLESAQLEISTRDRRQRKKLANTSDQIGNNKENTSSSQEGVRIKSAVRSTRDRLSYDAMKDIDEVENKRKKHTRKKRESSKYCLYFKLLKNFLERFLHLHIIALFIFQSYETSGALSYL